MVQLTVDSMTQPGKAANGDYYMCVRIGNSQKFSRVHDTQTFKFPPGGQTRFGRVDIFKRISTSVIDLSGNSSGMQELSVDGQQMSTEAFQFRVGVDLSTGVGAAEPPVKEEHVNQDVKKAAARDYLAKHSLELKLADAMQALLRSRPDDPAEFIAKHLTTGKTVVKSAASPTASPVAVKQSAATRAVAAPTPAPEAPRFACMSSSAFAQIYKKFPGRAAGATSMSSKPEVASSPRFALAPSVGTWLSPRLSAPAAQTPVCAASQAVNATDGFAGRPSVATWLLSAPPPGRGFSKSLSLSLDGFRTPADANSDELEDVERVAVKALQTLSDTLEGEYLPLRGSTTYCARPAGMSREEELALKAKGLLLAAANPCGRGVYCSNSKDVAVWINGESHLQILSKDPAKCESIENALRHALAQDGFILM
eukprot:TRINITY_DN6745_c0_g1_i2.p1 TRINITY_DN6745_c0_g1~~TRINITY_DN6745_c0_g1_i2.p1  ORF type:complete len:425 (-),score=96.72 TRINITY_DN6745_c0_g1_i2:23-1297(-)